MSVLYWTIEGKNIALEDVLTAALDLHSLTRNAMFIRILYAVDHPLIHSYTSTLTRLRDVLKQMGIEVSGNPLDDSTRLKLSAEASKKAEKVIMDAAEIVKEDSDKWRKNEHEICEEMEKIKRHCDGEIVEGTELHELESKRKFAMKQTHDLKRIYALVENHIEALYTIYSEDKLANV